MTAYYHFTQNPRSRASEHQMLLNECAHKTNTPPWSGSCLCGDAVCSRFNNVNALAYGPLARLSHVRRSWCAASDQDRCSERMRSRTMFYNTQRGEKGTRIWNNYSINCTGVQLFTCSAIACEYLIYKCIYDRICIIWKFVFNESHETLSREVLPLIYNISYLVDYLYTYLKIKTNLNCFILLTFNFIIIIN